MTNWKDMTSEELRQKFLEFFENKDHKVLPSSSLIPENDPSPLLTTAGMQQFKRWFSGLEKPAYPRVVTIQKCVRVGDIDEVGDDTHLSFFEMLGNFSFNSDYWKKEAIEWAIEFIRDELGVSFDRISFTYFLGDGLTPKDTESLKVFKKLNVPDEKIKGMGREDNFWGPTGDEGPCGPTVEVYIDGMEVWNLVFNEYLRTKEGKYLPLKSKGVDTGVGFERLLAVLNKKETIYETDLFEDILLRVRPLARVRDEHSERVIADHLRAATFLLADGVTPSNLDRGYVLRRLIRRAIRHGRVLGIEQYFCSKITEVIVGKFGNVYPELLNNRKRIFEELEKEEEKFAKGLEKGIREYKNNLESWRKYFKENNFPEFYGGVFRMYDTHGFPTEMTLELLQEDIPEMRDQKNIEKFWAHVDELFRKHQELSRIGAEKKFKGGLVAGGEMETKYHTATHLLNQALKTVLGDHVKQAGSNITAERLRFDFTHPEKMTPEEITEVENIVNGEIEKGMEVKCEEVTLEDAKKSGAIGIFDQKYGEKVKVYSIGEFSKEICGGPHVKNTKELGKFKITKEESSSAGVRRIKAILG